MISARLKNFIIGFLLIAIGYLLIATPSVSAQTVNPYTVPNTSPDVPRNQHVWTQTVMLDVMSAMICQIAGIDPTDPTGQCLGINPKTGQIGYVQGGGGAIGIVGNMIAATYTPPIHTGDYFNNLAQNFGITKKAYAQGIGLTGIQPLMKIWSVFRNITYLLLVIVFIFIGLAIMLRVKIDPRTVMSIENQIPKIIIGLVLVTFSFAIAGFLIDMMYVFIYLIFNLFNDPSIFPNPDALNQVVKTQAYLSGDHVFSAFNNLFGFLNIPWDTSASVSKLIQDMITGGPSTSTVHQGSPVPIWDGLLGFFDDAGKLLNNGTAFILSILGGLLAFLIIMIAVLWAMFRVWFSLIMAYIFILMDIALAPLWILVGLFPGSQIGFGAWLRDMGANLSAFPAVIAFLLAGKLFMVQFSTGDDVFVPPLIGNLGDGKAIGSIIGLGIILTTPQVVDWMKAAFKAPKIDISSIGKAIGVGAGVPGRSVGGGLNIAFGPKTDPKTGMLTYPSGTFARFMRAFGFVR